MLDIIRVYNIFKGCNNNIFIVFQLFDISRDKPIIKDISFLNDICQSTS